MDRVGDTRVGDSKLFLFEYDYNVRNISLLFINNFININTFFVTPIHVM